MSRAQERVKVALAPYLKSLTVDLGEEWSENFSSGYSADLPPRPRDSVGSWDWQIPRGLFIPGAVLLETIVLRGVAWPECDIQTLTFGRLKRFAYEGPAWLNAQDIDTLLGAAPVLRSLTLHLRTFESGEPTDVSPTLAASLRYIYFTVSHVIGQPLLLSYFHSRGAPDILGHDEFQAFRTFKLPRGPVSVSATITGYSISQSNTHLPRRRVRFMVGKTVRAISQFLLCLPQQIDLSDLTHLSLDEFVFVELLATSPPSPETHSLRNVATLPSVQKVVVWTAGCGQHSRHGANRAASWFTIDATGMFVALSSTTQITHLITEENSASHTFVTSTLAQRAAVLLSGLQILVISVGPDRLSRTVLRRRSNELCMAPPPYPDDPSRLIPRDPCACDNPPTIALCDVQDFLEQIRFPTLKRLEINGMHVVDVAPEVPILQLQMIGLDLEFGADAVECDVCTVPLGDSLDAKDMYDALDGW